MALFAARLVQKLQHLRGVLLYDVDLTQEGAVHYVGASAALRF
ncbi:hypothetical protein [Hyphomonas sediminis]|nr:hypothetical protein [Hyphomonas sediminis]